MTNGIGLTCRLCSGPGPLRRSHVVPKFVFEWLRTHRGGLRNLASPNLAVQDGAKPRLFCSACEGLLGAWERQVSEHLFRPLHSDTASSFTYGPWLLKFAVSVSFRVLALHGQEIVMLRDGPPVPSAYCAAVAHLRTGAGHWAQFLRGERKILGPYEHYCVALPLAPDQSPGNRRVEAYFNGEINIRPPVQAPDGGIYIVTKMCRLCIVGTVVRGRRNDWANAKIAARGGVVSSPYAVPPWLASTSAQSCA
jgi:hypothetical protein